MTDRPVIFLSGAGGGAPDLGVFKADSGDNTRFEIINYPGWQRYISDDFSSDFLIADLVEQIVARVPQGPIRIVGLSIGGHLGYAAALRLQENGREIGGFCAIDAFMIASSAPSAGWKGRAFAQGIEMLRRQRFADFIGFLRSKFWRALVRFSGKRLSCLLRITPSSLLSAIFALDPMLEDEVSMRLLIRKAAPWIAILDRGPLALDAPTVLLRTSYTAADDAAWRRRCPSIRIFEIPGQHHNLFEQQNVGSFREAFLAATRSWR
jgi:thioesterase domain-containing protein